MVAPVAAQATAGAAGAKATQATHQRAWLSGTQPVPSFIGSQASTAVHGYLHRK